MRHGFKHHHRKGVFQRGMNQAICGLVSRCHVVQRTQKENAIGQAQALQHRAKSRCLGEVTDDGKNHVIRKLM